MSIGDVESLVAVKTTYWVVGDYLFSYSLVEHGIDCLSEEHQREVGQMTAIILDLLWVTILLTHVLVQVADMFSLDILQKYVLQFAEFQEVLYLLGYCLFLKT